MSQILQRKIKDIEHFTLIEMNNDIVLETLNESYEPTIKLNPPVPESEQMETTDNGEMLELVRKSVNKDPGLVPDANWLKDKKSIAFLLFLYFLQGVSWVEKILKKHSFLHVKSFFYAQVPIGLATCLPLIMSARKASYTDLGMFSFTFLPFSLKVIWAPIIDSVFLRRFGRRKSWLVPTQFLIGNYNQFLIFVLAVSKFSASTLFFLILGIFMLSFASLTQNTIDSAGEPDRMKNGQFLI